LAPFVHKGTPGELFRPTNVGESMTTKKRGFTLIELMIVVAIIGILAAIAIPNFIKFQAKGKQSEVNANLKAIFSAQKSAFPTLSGYWSDIGGIGFAPERGNRYRYDLGAAMATVALSTEGACGVIQDRTGALAAAVDGTCGISADIARHGDAFTEAMIAGYGGFAAAPMAFVPEGTNMAVMAQGTDGAQCPACDFAAVAHSNIDNDNRADVWWVSSQTIETVAVMGCPGDMTIALMNAYTSGTPAVVQDDVCNEE
jgi:type IV pilus assembly protein PilA